MDDVIDVDVREKIFHNAVREYIIWLLLFILLYVSSYAVICAYKRRTDREDYYSGWSRDGNTVDSEDAVVYRVSLWLCTFTLAVSGGAVLLLPISIGANEAVHAFPNSYYLQWVQSSLIHGLWTQIFLASNLCLFVLMPFAYLFTESEGLPGSRRGIMSRFYETSLVLFLLTILVCGLAWVASAIIDNDKSSRKALFDIWDFYLPYLYSCISLLGVVLLLICTPVGFARLFTVMGELVVKPKFLRDLAEELHTVLFEEETLKRKITHRQGPSLANGHNSVGPSSTDHNNGHKNGRELLARLEEVQKTRSEIEKRQQVSSLRRNFGYPFVMLLLLGLTSISVLMVAQNTIELLIGLKALPRETKEIVLGITSLSALGPVGAAIEIIIILYLMWASVVGFYTLPGLRQIQPKLHDTPMTKIIANCVIIMVLSSALPVLSRTLGITDFDLLGNFGRLEWLGNFYIVFAYNVIFAVATALCLTTKFTATMRQELYSRVQMALNFKMPAIRVRRTAANSNGANTAANNSSMNNSVNLSHLKDD